MADVLVFVYRLVGDGITSTGCWWHSSVSTSFPAPDSLRKVLRGKEILGVGGLETNGVSSTSCAVWFSASSGFQFR